MKAKDYLMQYQDSRKRIRHLEEEILEVRHAMASVSKPIGSGSHPSNPITTSPQEKLIYRLMELESNKAKEQRECFDLMDYLSRQIDSLGGTYSDLLHKRYICWERFEQVSLEMHYSYERVRHLHREALTAFERKFPEIEGLPDTDRMKENDIL